MLVFTPLASSSAGCCYKVSGGGASAPLLIEAGIMFRQIQVGTNFQTLNLAGCVISHHHGDHARSAKDLLFRGVPTYASSESWEKIGGAGGRTLKPKEITKVGDWDVLPFEVVHDAPGTLGFVIGSPDGSRLLYLTDTAYSPYRYEGLTHIAIEANFSEQALKDNAFGGSIDPSRMKRTYQTHMSLERLVKMLDSNDLSRVEEIHLLHLSDKNSDEAAFKAAVQEATGVPVYVAPRGLA